MARVTAINHVSIVARDLDESTRFYEQLFDARVVPSPRFGIPVRWLQLGASQLHLFEAPETAAARAHLALTVDDVVAVAREAQRRGILDRTTFGYPAALLPGGEAQLYLRDPAGNLVEVDHPDGAQALAAIPGMVALAEHLPQPDGPLPRLSLDDGR
jgi:catechol 2,3-dioxygenase-like lactoylglutathione lyase family enzyme